MKDTQDGTYDLLIREIQWKALGGAAFEKELLYSGAALSIENSRNLLRVTLQRLLDLGAISDAYKCRVLELLTYGVSMGHGVHSLQKVEPDAAEGVDV